jgi:hypothetical protein
MHVIHSDDVFRILQKDTAMGYCVLLCFNVSSNISKGSPLSAAEMRAWDRLLM